mgnify:FL=1
MNKKYGMFQPLASAFVFFLVFATVVGYGFAEGKTETEMQKGWQEVMVFKPVSATHPIWCGSKGIIITEWEMKGNEAKKYYGGIVHINIESKKKALITREILTKNPFCNYDGSFVFYFQWQEDPKQYERMISGGIWMHDLKTGKKQEIGYAITDYFKNPASPTEKVFALIGVEKQYLQIWKANLPDWKILYIPKDRSMTRSYGGSVSQWASDGSYFMLNVIDYNERGKDSFIFYDKKGRLIRNIPVSEVQAVRLKIMGDGVYFFREDGRLRRLNPWTGKIEDLPLQVVISKGFNFQFDASMNREVAYTRNDHEIGLWIDSIHGNKAQEISEEGTFPVFSRSGEYIAFIKEAIDPNDPHSFSWVLVVMKRNSKMTR